MSHASGIVASPELVSEFAKAKDDASVRFIQVAVEGTVLVSKRVGPKEADTAADLQGLKKHLEPTTPSFIVLRLDDAEAPGDWLLVMFVPDEGKVREKMLYASSRDALKRDLGYSCFKGEMHASDMEEVSYERYQQQVLVSDTDRLSLMSEKERMLAKELNTHVDTGISKSSYVHSVQLPLTPEAESAIKAFVAKSANFVRLKADTAKEVIDLDDSQTLQGGFARFKGLVCVGEEPRYCLYSHEAEGAASPVTVFVFFCPEGAKVREKMLYSTAKAACIGLAEQLGVTVDKKLEVRDSSDLTEAELQPSEPAAAEPAAPAISRPRGPGGKRGLTKVPVVPQ
mmetsp:Transcript_3326/g.7841  ORF Transcript_3326/g.7841 Transcript_3326/m.7841 type:complete len:341 (-) Transcript_3326:71-1093(-)|eukprot:CAMPEP_0177709692 /NCGR_PEP_ID=MMETSP0484_2-20121128/10938_1 /TAXON_ID=354590 /ORGANISM="Rhodomonas lens, Strain RHODO" /LENGTH=340 /DNA_ID=CAMNT_0019221325 /DNA_START=73 /DNA_END=1095 /DNA_ORIENTATION=-